MYNSKYTANSGNRGENMKKEFIIPLPIFNKEKKIRNVTEQIYEKFDNVDYLILVDKYEKFVGCVKLTYLLKVINLGAQLGWTLESVMEEKIIIVRMDEYNFTNSIIENIPIIIVDNLDKPLGMLNKPAYLLEQLGKKVPDIFNINELFIQKANFGFLLVSSTGIVIHHNITCQSMIGNNMLGKHINNFYPGDYMEDYKKNRVKKLFSGRIFEWTFYSIEMGDESKHIAISIFDITRTEQYRNNLIEAEAKIKDLFDVIDYSYDEIFVTDSDGVCTLVNKACERFYGVSKEQMIGKTAQQLESEGIVSSSISHRVIEEKRRITNIQSTGIGRKIIVTGNPIFNSQNQVEKVIINARELTELSNIMSRIEDSSHVFNKSELDRLTKIKLITEGIVIESHAMKQVINIAQRVSQVNSNVLILGESGVGKGMITKLIHELSPRNKAKIIKVNCSSIPETLIESELFGYEKGAFTGAIKEGKVGLFELAHEGTIFLDEIGEIPLQVQTKLLQAIQEKEIMRVGGTKTIHVDCRIIAATNRNLTEMVKEGTFREDLYYRLNVIPIQVPSLRKRKEEIPSLVQNFIHNFNQRFHFEKSISREAMTKLMNYYWPGNIRELENTIERIMVTTQNNIISANDFELHHNLGIPNKNMGISIEQVTSLKEAIENVESELIKKVMTDYKTTYEAAKILQVNQSTIVRKIQKYNIQI